MTLHEKLAALGLRHTSLILDDLVATATKRRMGLAEILEKIADDELVDRTHRSLERRLECSKIGRFKPMADFDWNWPKKIDRPNVESALRLEFLEHARNIVLVAPQGLGKTMIAQNIAYSAVQAGHSALFTTASQLLIDLCSQETARNLDRRLKYYCNQIGLLVLDEIGYLSYDNRNADLLYQVISRRYERKSLVLTTNLAFSNWPNIFPNATSAIALIDRVVHHSEIIAIEGASYRCRAAELSASSRRSKRGRDS